MKNGYLLLITILAGIAGQTAQAADIVEELRASEKWPTVSQSIWSVFSQHPAIAKPAALLYAPPARLTQDQELRKYTYQTVHSCLAKQNIKPQYANWYLKIAENLMLNEGTKYDSGFTSRFPSWTLSNSWVVADENDKRTYNMPAYCIAAIIKNGELISADRGFFHHERGHDYLNHMSERKVFLEKIGKKKNVTSFYQAKNKDDFLQISNKKELLDDLISFHRLCVEQEEQADAFVPEDPTLLAAMTKFFTFIAHNSTIFDPEHPPAAQRAECFKNRFKTVIQSQNEEEEELDRLIDHYSNDFSIRIEPFDANTNLQPNSLDLSDEYNVYLALRPAILKLVTLK